MSVCLRTTSMYTKSLSAGAGTSHTQPSLLQIHPGNSTPAMYDLLLVVVFCQVVILGRLNGGDHPCAQHSPKDALGELLVHFGNCLHQQAYGKCNSASVSCSQPCK